VDPSTAAAHTTRRSAANVDLTEPDRLLRGSFATLEAATEAGAGRGLAAAVEREATEVLAELEAAGLRGRGGAGFPTARKWASTAATATATDSTLTIVVNAAEGEPGTYKDRTLLEHDPYAVLEGACIALATTGATAGYIGLKERAVTARERLTTALEEVRAAGWYGADRLHIVAGPDLYLLGEESGLLEVIEGNLPMPRISKPFDVGLWPAAGRPNPSIVNNVETLAHVAWILANGAGAFRRMGTETSPGTMLFTVVGDVPNAGVYELPLGTPLRTLLVDIAGADADDIKAVYSGVSTAVILPEHLDVPLGFDEMREAGVGLGSGGFIVYDRSRSIIDVLSVLVGFLAVESCGQCNACKLGNTEMAALLRRCQEGDAEPRDLEALLWRARTVTDQNRCYLPVGSQLVVGSTVAAFVDEFVETVQAGAPTPADLPTPIVDRIDPDTGAVEYHPRYHLKRTDWSYADVDPSEERLRALRGD
jgi:NADH-quinone oxidoreductase subunit F